MKLLIFFLSYLLASQAGIYDFSITDMNGNQVHLGDFRGKKMLIVNTALHGKYAVQYASLEQLYQKYKDSLVIIAIPSNDFGNDSGNETGNADTVVNKYHINYILGSRLSVTGTAISPVFKWLSESDENGVADNPVIGDFFKYLIDDEGNLIAVFASQVDPMDSLIQQAITGTDN